MSKRDDVHRLRKGREFIDYAVRQGCETRGGRHVFVRNPQNGRGCPVPNHPGDLPTGTRLSIIKSFVAMGIAIFIVACAISAFVPLWPSF